MDSKTFTVQRSRWYRGQGPEHSLLRNLSGQQCCLGFVGEQCEVPSDELLGKVMPELLSGDMYARYPKLPRDMDWCDFSTINDHMHLTEEEREQQLQQLAKRAGFELVFVD